MFPIFYKIIPNILIVCFCLMLCHVPCPPIDSLLMREIFYVKFEHNLILFYLLPLHFHCINSNSFLLLQSPSPLPPLLLWFSLRSFRLLVILELKIYVCLSHALFYTILRQLRVTRIKFMRLHGCCFFLCVHSLRIQKMDRSFVVYSLLHIL